MNNSSTIPTKTKGSITNLMFGRQPDTGSRIKQAFMWLCVIPQAVAGWLVTIKYVDLVCFGAEFRWLGTMDRFWLHMGILALIVILIMQIYFVWTLRGAYHRVEHVKETRIIHQGNEQSEPIELDTWLTKDTDAGLESIKIKEDKSVKEFLANIIKRPPQSLEECKALQKIMKKRKDIDISVEPYKSVYLSILSKGRDFRRESNRKKKDELAAPYSFAEH